MPGDAGGGARCFIAVWPSAELVELLLAAERPARPGLRWTPAEQWHVTLKFFAAVDPRALAAALDRAAARPGWPAARAVAGPTPRAMSRRLWVVPVSGLEALAAAIDAATAGLDTPLGVEEGAGPGGSPGLAGRPGLPDPPDPSDPSGRPDAQVAGRGSRPRPGRGARERAFRGHITLARAQRPPDLRRLPLPPLSVGWQVDSMGLVLSELGPGGARHEVLRRWPLPPTGAAGPD